MGKRSRDKGKRVELEIVHRHRDLGIDAERVPLSGASGGRFTGDIVIDQGGSTLRAEVKARADGAGFKQLETWLGDNDLLFLRRDRAEPMVLLTWRTYADLISE